MNITLKGKRAVVCGSTQGIGKATAIELAELGASIVLLARNPATLEQTRKELTRDDGQEHFTIACDFTNTEPLQEQTRAFISEHGPAHILVNNTGGPPAGPVFDAVPEEFLKALTMHVLANQVLVQALVPGMKEAGYGRIINVISTSVKQPIKNLGVSNTIRGAVANWSKTLAGELAPFGITVNNVLPGATNTTRLENLIKNTAEKSNRSEAEVAQAMKAAIPARRFGETEELAAAVAFLASPAASYINGINLPVDGGRTASL